MALSGILDCQTHRPFLNASRALEARPSGLDFVSIEDGYIGMLCALDSVGDASCWNRNGRVNYLQLEPRLLTAPTDFRASIYSSNFLELFWGGKTFSDEMFEIYRNDELIDPTDNESSYPESGLETGVEYSNRIRSIRPDGSVSGFRPELLKGINYPPEPMKRLAYFLRTASVFRTQPAMPTQPRSNAYSAACIARLAL